MRELEGLDYEEIAAACELTTDAVRSRSGTRSPRASRFRRRRRTCRPAARYKR